MVKSILKKFEKNIYTHTQPQKSARFSFRVVWFVHVPVTHPTLRPPTHGKHSLLFIFKKSYSFMIIRSVVESVLLLFSLLLVAYRIVIENFPLSLPLA